MRYIPLVLIPLIICFAIKIHQETRVTHTECKNRKSVLSDELEREMILQINEVAKQAPLYQ